MIKRIRADTPEGRGLKGWYRQTFGEELDGRQYTIMGNSTRGHEI